MENKLITNGIPQIEFKFNYDLLTKYKKFGFIQPYQPERLNPEDIVYRCVR